ncbi:MAG: AraC family transcriptional regulator N-terminal domain-containing protein [bacterium]
MVLKGRKQVSIGDHTVGLGPGECLLVSHDLPVYSGITEAPYLAMVFGVDITVRRTLYD